MAQPANARPAKSTADCLNFFPDIAIGDDPFALVLKILGSQLDIFFKIIIGARFGKIIGGTIMNHETVQIRAFQVGDFFYQILREPVVNKFFLFFQYQSFLECQHATVLIKSEHADDGIQVQPCSETLGAISYFKFWFLEIEHFCVV